MKPEDRLKLYGALILVAVALLVYVGATFSVVPMGSTTELITDNYVWNFYPSKTIYQIGASLDTAPKYNGEYACVWGNIVYFRCIDPTLGSEYQVPDSKCSPHYTQIACKSGACTTSGMKVYAPTTLVSEADLYNFYCVPTESYEQVDKFGLYIQVRTFDGQLVKDFKSDYSAAPYLSIDANRDFPVGFDKFTITNSNYDADYFEGYMTDGRCTWKLCFGSGCSDFIQSLDCIYAGPPSEENPVPPEPAPSQPEVEPVTPTEPTEPTQPVEEKDNSGCIIGQQEWCAELNQCIPINSICEDGIISAPISQEPETQPINVPETNCDYSEQPVCGTNGVTYLNDCWRQAYSVPKLVDGFCNTCGNDIREPGEECDGTNIKTACKDLGWQLGQTTCNPDCTINSLDCRNPVCGNGIAEVGESWLNCCTDTSCPSQDFTCTDNACIPNTLAGKCIDGTSSQSCSSSNPSFFCNQKGQLIKDCIQCGGCKNVCTTGQTKCESGNLFKCYNNQYSPVQQCELGCKDTVQCRSKFEPTVIGGNIIINYIQKALQIPQQEEIKKGVSPTSREQTLNDLFSARNIALIILGFVLVLIIRDTITGELKWALWFKKLKRKVGL